MDSPAHRVVMLLDNHYAPDRRVEMESELLRRAGSSVRVVAWDRRPRAQAASGREGEGQHPKLVRVNVEAPSGGGKRTFVAMLSFARAVWRRRREFAGDADVLVVHDVYLLPLGVLLSIALHVPLVYDAHEDYAAMEGLRYPRWWLQLVTSFESLLARRASVIVVPGDSRRERWERAGFEPPVVLRNLGLGRERGPVSGDRSWDIAYCGTIADVRRLDVLLEAARRRPDLRVLIAGRGRGAPAVERAAAALPNVDYRGWIDDADAVVGHSRAVYYGLDPEHPYAPKACPNTLYDALRLRRPLLYFCGGEVASVASSYHVGVACRPTPESLLAGFDAATNGTAAWQFDEAWAALTGPETADRYVNAVLGAATRGTGRIGAIRP